MAKKKYDIFISYRRKDAGDKAEHLKDLLEPKFKGRISFDRENLTGLFDVALARRIDNCKDFLLVVGKKSLLFEEKDFEDEQVALYSYLGFCTQEEFEQKIIELGPNAPIDFVRIEIARALHCKDITIIPVVPETTESFNFSKLNLPSDIVGVKRYEAVFYSDNPDALFKDVVPKILPRLRSKPSSMVSKLKAWLLLLILTVAVCGGGWLLQQSLHNKAVMALKVETALDGEQYLNWSDDISLQQLEAINHILSNMVKVEGGTFMMGASPNADGSYDKDVDIDLETPEREQAVETFWMCKYEVSVSEWYGVWAGVGGDLQSSVPDLNMIHMPMTNVSFDDCQAFCETLSNLTGLAFRLPSEAEWEYAARGGAMPDSTKYAGRDNPDEVAWYGKNANGKPHVCDASNSPMHPNGANLYDMSGNVSEWCDTDFRPYNPDVPVIDPEAKVIRGGNYDSELYGITVYHRDPMNTHEKTATVGLRLVISSH